MPHLERHFGHELLAAGIGNLPIGWTFGPNAVITGYDDLTAEQRAALDEVIARHDPNKPPDDYPRGM